MLWIGHLEFWVRIGIAMIDWPVWMSVNNWLTAKAGDPAKKEDPRLSSMLLHHLTQGTLKGEVSLYCWSPVWLVWNQLFNNWQFLFLFAKTEYSKQEVNCTVILPPVVFPAWPYNELGQKSTQCMQSANAEAAVACQASAVSYGRKLFYNIDPCMLS